MNLPGIQASQPVSIEEKPQDVNKIPRAKAIQICKDKYPDYFKKKKILTLAIAIGAIALLVIPAMAFGLAALSLCTFEIGLLFVTPVAIIAISILIKKIDDKTLYWSGDLARITIKKHEEKARKAAEKAKTVEIKS